MRTVIVALVTLLCGCADMPHRGADSGGTADVRYSPPPAPPGYPLSHERSARDLPSRIALAPANEPGEPMIISGTVYEIDGATPAKDAVVFLYQTDARGVYSDEKENSGRPKLRGYLKTDDEGKYEITSIRPGLYPHIKAPAHIHVHVWAPNQPEYEDLFQFYDDPLITERLRARAATRPGLATQPAALRLIKLTADDQGVLRGVRNIKPQAAPPQTATTQPAVAANPQLEKELATIILEIAEDVKHGSGRVFGRYARDIVAADGFTFTSEAGEVRRHIPIRPMHPLEKRTTELVDVRAREHGDTVILNYQQLDRVQLKDQKFTESSRKTVVFLRRDGSWKIVSYQSSPVGFERVAATVDTNILDAYVGTYQNPLWGIYYVTREGNELVFTSANGYRSEYLPESETEFFEKDEQARQATLQTVSFVRNDKGRVTHCVFRQHDGQNVVAEKIR